MLTIENQGLTQWSFLSFFHSLPPSLCAVMHCILWKNNCNLLQEEIPLYLISSELYNMYIFLAVICNCFLLLFLISIFTIFLIEKFGSSFLFLLSSFLPFQRVQDSYNKRRNVTMIQNKCKERSKPNQLLKPISRSRMIQY